MSYDGPNPLPIVRGGTNASTMSTTDGVVYYDGTRLVTTTAGTATQVLTSNGPGVAPTYQAVSASGAVTSLDVQANTAPGTDPVLPTAGGVITVNGAAVANHSVVLETRSRAANAYNLEVQYATSAAATDATKSGVSHFNSSQFSVDANGFVALAGGGEAIDSIGTQTGTNPISPTAGGLVTINGATVAAGTNPVRTDGTGANTMAVEVQISQALAATDATKIGLSNFDSSSFAVDANGFVTTSSTGVLKTLTGNSGGAISPTAGNINTLGTGSITIAGAGSTLTTQLTGLTNHAVLVGAGTATITNVGPTATVGQVLQSAGAAADPAYSTATYPLTTTVSQILYSSSTNVVSGLATANRAVLTTGTTGIPVLTALAADGQLIIGSTAGSPAAATITAGAGISVTNGSNSITIASTGAGFTWSDTSGTVTAVAENGYFITAVTTSTLPAAPAEGDTVRYIVDTASALTITAAGSQKIRVGNTLSAAGGTTVNSQQGDAIELVYRTSGTTWFAANNPVGAWTTA